MVGIYLSGTGNTRHCVERLVKGLDETAQCIAIEDKSSLDAIKREDMIVLGYPVQFSNVPVMVRDLINNNARAWKGKKVICIATLGGFSGDGAGCSARLLKKCGAHVLGGLHLKMPDSVCDSKALKKTMEQNRAIIKSADEKIDSAIDKIKSGAYPREGLNMFCHIAGLLGQRLWFYGKTKDYSDQIKISDACIGCGSCEKICPMNNIELSNGRAVASNKCTMCYRCISHCPERAITLLGKKVHEQCNYERYEIKL